jgi:predicted permease
MSFLDAARYRLRNLLRAAAADQERQEEYEFHRSLAAAAHANDTGDAADAPAAARRAFGNETLIREDVRWMGAVRWIDQLGQDLRFVGRTFRRSPLFAVVAVVSIGLAIGANTAVFGVIDELLLKRLAVSQPDQLRQLWRADGRGGREPFFNAAEFEALRAASGADVALLAWASALHAEIGGASYSRLSFNSVDGAFFPLLGVGAAAGRLLTPADDHDAAPVAVLGYGSASRYFGSPADAVGRRITLQGHVFTIVGVLPREFRGLFVESPMTIVVPYRTTPLLRNSWSPRDGAMLTLVTRLGHGSEQKRRALEHAFAGCCANGELVTPGAGTANPIRMKGQRLDFSDISRGIPVGKFDVRAMFGRLLYTLMAGVAIVLLIACTNVGNLLLARATARSREIAVRMSLGASRGRIVRQLLAESVVLAATGAALGVALAVWGTAMLPGTLPGNLRILEPFVSIRPNRSVTGFTAATAVLCTIIFGVLPAIRATRIDPVAGLRTSSAGATRSGRLDRGIIAVQMALALVLVASAGLLDATFRNLKSGLGDIDVDRLLVAEVESSGTSIPRGGERDAYDRIFERLRTVPGVATLAATDVMPMMYLGFTSSELDIPGHEPTSDAPLDRSPLAAGIIHTTPGFFRTTGSDLVAGRDFNEGDVAGAPLVAVINETIARQFFAGRDPIGQTIGFRGDRRRMQVIGIARDVKQTDLRAPNPRSVYLPRAQRQNDGDRFIYAMRIDGDAGRLATAARAAISEAAPEISIRFVRPMAELVAFSVARERALALVALMFSAVAVGLAAIGLYGVMAYQVTSRSREIGIRMALGADSAGVVRLVMRQSLAVLAAGIALGLPLALAATSALRALLYGVTPFAPTAFAVAVLVLVAAGIAATLLPSRHASRVDPLVTLKAE